MKPSDLLNLALLLLLKFSTSLCQISAQEATVINDGPKPGQTGNVVRTSDGAVFGAFGTTKNKQMPFFAYKGIPYAVPPLGDLRFKDPVPFPSWRGVRLATEAKDYCLGFVFSFMTGEEDCLYLSVYVPQRPRDASKPASVIFWIHGGGFQHGSDLNTWLYYPGPFLEHDIIFVSPNYRMGALGFLSTDDSVAPGNYGLKDVILALQWTKRNIRHFGGDPDAITVMGQSAGGAMANLLAYSPAAQGLFRAGISMSAGALVNWGIHAMPRLVANRMAEVMRCPNGSSEAIVSCLRQRGAKELIYADKEFFTLPGARYAIPFAPRVDKDAEFPVLPQHPLMMIMDSQFQPKPWIFGYTKDEALSFYWSVYYDKDLIGNLDSVWDMQCKRYIFAHLGSEQALPPPQKMLKVCRKIRKLYFGNKRIGFNTNAEFTQLGTDALIAFSTLASAILQSRGTPDVWFYRYDYVNEDFTFLNAVNVLYDVGMQGFVSKTRNPVRERIAPGAGHMDELVVLMSPPEFGPQKPKDAAVQKVFCNSFSSFIKFGDPNVDNPTLPQPWPRFNEREQELLVIDMKTQIKNHPISKDRQTVWAKCYDLLFQDHQHFQIPSLAKVLGFKIPGELDSTGIRVQRSNASRAAVVGPRFSVTPREDFPDFRNMRQVQTPFFGRIDRFFADDRFAEPPF